MHRAASLALVVPLAAAAACATAGGESTGGELTPAGAAATTPAVFTPPTADAGYPDTCSTGGSTWTELYTDIFATGSVGSCTYESGCHGHPNGEGAQAANGLQCFDQEGCRTSIIGLGLATPADASRPLLAKLFTAELRTRDPSTGVQTGTMPSAPQDYVFPQACVARIAVWVANGVPDD